MNETAVICLLRFNAFKSLPLRPLLIEMTSFMRDYIFTTNIRADN